MVIETGYGGSIDPGGAVVVHGGDDQTFVMTPEGTAPVGAYFEGVGDPGDWSGVSIMLDRWEAQTFRPTANFTAWGVSLPMMRYGAPGIVFVTLHDTDINGHPTAPNIAVGYFDADSELSNSEFNWYWVGFDSPVDLISGVKYAIVVDALDSGESAYVVWAYEEGNGYPTGNPEESVDGGASWMVPYEGVDHHDHPFDCRYGEPYYVAGIFVDSEMLDIGPYGPGEVVEYTFEDVMADHTIQVWFSRYYYE